MKIYAPPLTTWTCHTLSVRTTNWPTSLTTTTSPWWLTTATCARTSRYRMANSAPNCALTSKAAKSYWWVVHQCRLTDIFHISDSGCFILIADNSDLRDDLKILNVELCLKLCYWWVADGPTSLAMAIRMAQWPLTAICVITYDHRQWAPIVSCRRFMSIDLWPTSPTGYSDITQRPTMATLKACLLF